MAGDQGLAEFNRFCSFFTNRMVQVVIESRQGRRIRTQMRPVSRQTDWFNLSINESSEVTQVLKDTLGDRTLCQVGTVSLVISLCTAEGESLDLEIWSLSLDEGVVDRSVSIRSYLYHRLCVMLRSVVCASRSTPVYRQYACRQDCDSFVLCYQICTESQLPVERLGEQAKHCELGCLSSPYGTLHLNLHFRTEMVINKGAEEDALKLTVYSGKSKFSMDPFEHRMAKVKASADLDDPKVDHQLDSWYPLAEPVFSSACDSGQRLSLADCAADPSSTFLSRAAELTSLSCDSQNLSESFICPDENASEPLQPGDYRTWFGSPVKPKDASESSGDLCVPNEDPLNSLALNCSAASLSSMGPRVRRRLTSFCDEEVKLTPIGECNEAENSTAEVYSSDSASSSCSFVRIERRQVFATNDGNADLGTLYREFKSAPSSLESFLHACNVESSRGMHSTTNSNADQIEFQLDQFVRLQPTFDSFLQSLKAEEEEES